MKKQSKDLNGLFVLTLFFDYNDHLNTSHLKLFVDSRLIAIHLELLWNVLLLNSHNDLALSHGMH